VRRPRILLAKPGLDGHDRGIKVIAMGLRDAGIEVIYLGLRQTVKSIVRAAEEEDVDCVGISVLSGAHMTFGRSLLDEAAARGLEHLPIVVGGTIPPRDVARLKELGVAAVFPVGTPLAVCVQEMVTLASRDREGARQ
jgi:methylmalonyl-CoA mutase C-terminal domain/subunit